MQKLRCSKRNKAAMRYWTINIKKRRKRMSDLKKKEKNQ